MKLTVIGCSGSFPSATSPGSCYLVEHNGHRLLLDLGNGALSGLQRHLDLSDENSIAGLVISHHHNDHVADVEALRVLRQYRPSGRMPNLRVISSRPLGVGFDVTPHKGTQVIGPFSISSVEMTHSLVSHAVRVEADGQSLVYSGDTGFNERIVHLTQGVDVALLEASWTDSPDRPVDVHMSGREAAHVARRAGVRHLVLTHVVPWSNAALIQSEAFEVFDGRITMAEPDLVIEW